MHGKNRAEKVRFISVGLANTAIDFGVLFSLTSAGMNIIGANYISTSCALVFSFFANKHYTFRSGVRGTQREFILFLMVTLLGLWALQPLIIWLVSAVGQQLPISEIWLQLLAKITATVATMIWNYILYKRVVFRTEQNN